MAKIKNTRSNTPFSGTGDGNDSGSNQRNRIAKAKVSAVARNYVSFSEVKRRQ